MLRKRTLALVTFFMATVMLFWSCSKTDTEPIVLVPSITSVSPASGFIGDEVTITGTNFNLAAKYNEVKIGGIATEATSATPTSITANVPAGAKAGLVELTVKAYGVITSSLDFTVIWPAPEITMFKPGYGYADDTITIEGANFSTDMADNSVSFNGTPATIVSAENTAMQVIVPAGVATGDVTVSVLGQASNAVKFFVPVNPATVEYLITDSNDDGEESLITGIVETGSSDLDMGNWDTNKTPDLGNDIVGVRHPGVMVPKGATIISAHLQFQVYDDGLEPCQMTIYGEDAGDALPWSESVDYSMSSKTKTAASIVWDIPVWPTIDDRGEDQRTPDLRAIIQTIVDRGDWVSGNAMAFLLYPSGPSVGKTIDDGGESGREANGGTGDGPSLVIIYEQ